MSDQHVSQRTWLDKLSHALLGEPHDTDHLRDILKDAHKREILSLDALDMMEGALQVSEKRVRDIMVPRAQMGVIDKEMPLPDILSRIVDLGFSRYPVVEEGKDEVVGVLIAKDLLKFAFEPQRIFRIDDVLRPAVFVPESKHLNDLLKEFRHSHQHMAIVVNEYGGVGGLATIEDVLEQIVGEIEDEHDPEEEANIQPSSDRRFIIKSTTPVAEFNDFFGTAVGVDDIETIGGVVTNVFGYLPKRGEKVSFDGLNFTVMHADSRRIRLLKLLLDVPLGKGESKV